MFRRLEDASSAVSGIIASGIVPGAIEMMDHLCIQAAEAAVHAGYPENAGAILLVEVDGLHEEVEEETAEIERVCQAYDPIEIRTASDAAERERLWAGRKGVLGALGRLAPNYYLVDGTIPRTKLMEVLSEITAISERFGLPIANLLHAGDGNLHPSVLYDERKPGETRRALDAGGEILKLCVEAGGALSGEHGIGLEKQEYMPLMFTDDGHGGHGRAQARLRRGGHVQPRQGPPHRRSARRGLSRRRRCQDRRWRLHIERRVSTKAPDSILRFKERVGGAGVEVSHGGDASDHKIDGRAPQTVAYPKDIQQLSKLMAAANDCELAVAPRGGGTQTDLGNPSSRTRPRRRHDRPRPSPQSQPRRPYGHRSGPALPWEGSRRFSRNTASSWQSTLPCPNGPPSAVRWPPA